MRLIDADALTQLLQTCADDKWNKNTSAGTWSNAYEEMILHVEDMPTIEPERTGRWIWCGGSHKCSYCNEYTCFDKPVKYCPNCGAKMEVEHERSD